MTAENKSRIVIYSQDSLGLGHLRRNSRLSQRLLAEARESSVLLLADSPVAPFFRLPDGVDHIKLPSIRKIRAGVWQPTRLRVEAEDLRLLRADLLRAAVVGFRPDLVLVDHMPVGAQGELLPALEALKHAVPDCFIVLGLRDILDTEHVIVDTWRRDGAYDALRRYYDRVLIYGTRALFDTARTYRLPETARGIHYCGYVAGEDPIEPASEIRRQLLFDRERFVLVAAGGGADGHSLMRAYLRAIRLLGCRADFATLMAVGVNARPEVFRELKAEARGLPVQVVPYLEDYTSWLAAADLIVCMAGYNTLSEVCAFRKKALVVPRSGPSAEQRMRAQLFAKMAMIDMIDPRDLSPNSLAQRLVADLERDDYPAKDTGIDTSGTRQAVARLLELVGIRACGVTV